MAIYGDLQKRQFSYSNYLINTKGKQKMACGLSNNNFKNLFFIFFYLLIFIQTI